MHFLLVTFQSGEIVGWCRGWALVPSCIVHTIRLPIHPHASTSCLLFEG